MNSNDASLLLMAEILHQLIASFPIIYGVSYIPGGAGFQPSTVAETKALLTSKTNEPEARNCIFFVGCTMATKVARLWALSTQSEKNFGNSGAKKMKRDVVVKLLLDLPSDQNE